MKWVEDKFGTDAVSWVFFCATIMLAVAGVAGTIFFAVAGMTAGLNVSIPAIIVGVFGVPVTLAILEGKEYV